MPLQDLVQDDPVNEATKTYAKEDSRELNAGSNLEAPFRFDGATESFAVVVI